MNEKLNTPTMTRKRGSWKSACLAGLVWLGMMGAGWGQAPPAGRYVWMYGFESLDNAVAVGRLAGMQVSQVLLSTDARQLLPSGENASPAYTDKMRDFLSLAQAAGIGVHAMTLEDTAFAFVDKHARGRELVGWIADFCADAGTPTPFAGVHIDTEPHATQLWDDARNAEDWPTIEGLMQQYADLLQALYADIQAAPVPLFFSPAVHWKYNEWAAEGKIPSAAAANLGQYTDFLVPMVYETDRTDWFYNRTVDETAVEPTLVGIRAADFAEYGALEDSVATLDARFAGEGNYLGVAIFKYATLEALYAATGVYVDVPDTTAFRGSSVPIPVRVSDTTDRGIAAAEVFISYDGDLLTATRIDTAGTLLTANWSLDENLVQGNATSIDTVKVVAVTSLDTLAGAGLLFEIDFTAADIRHPAAGLLVPHHVLFNDGVPPALTASASFVATGTSGTISGDPAQPRPGESVTVSVNDGDEDRDPGTAQSLGVRVRNGGQTETLTVAESGVSTGLFVGSMATELSASPVSGDGVVQVQPGETISFCFDDSLDAAGATVERCATATVLTGHDGEIRTTAVAQPGDTVRVRVTDADLAGAVSVSAVNARTSEAETILLSQFAAGSSAFYGRFFTSAQASGSGDSALQVGRGDTLIVSYADELTAVGGTANAQDDAEVVDPFGDADGEGHARAFDAARVLQHRLERLTTGQALLVGLDSLAANVDGEAPFGPIDAYDASLILKRVVSLVSRFEVQGPASANHPQPETGARPKTPADERELTLRLGPGYASVWMAERDGIAAGEMLLKGIVGQVEMGTDLSDFLHAWRTTEDGMRVVFAGLAGAAGPGELLRVVVPEAVQGAELAAARFNGGRIAGRTAGVEPAAGLPTTFALHGNTPNPFNPETAIRFDLPAAATVRLEVFDALGQKVRVLVADQRPAGAHRVAWDGRDEAGNPAASGIFFCRLQARSGADGFAATRRMLLLK